MNRASFGLATVFVTVLLVVMIGAIWSRSSRVPEAPASATGAPIESDRKTQDGTSPAGATEPDFHRLAERATDRGLRWLAKSQSGDGSWYCDVGYKLNESYEVRTSVQDQMKSGGGHVGVSALAGMAFLGADSRKATPAFENALERATTYVASCVKEDGYITDNQSDMYSHAFATMFLAQVYGETKRHDLLEKLWMATDLIEKGQNASGGWRYMTFSQDSDLSITSCQLLALREAERQGVEVKAETMNRAAQYVRACAIDVGKSRGAFKYQDRPIYQTRASFPLTAAALTVLRRSGLELSDPLWERGLQYLWENDEPFHEVYRNHYFFYYGHFFASQAMKSAGSEWLDRYRGRIQRHLVDSQLEGGSWKDNVGEAHATAMAVLILETVR